MVDVRFHRQGLGSRLLSHSERVLFQTHRELVLESFEDNVAASSFYRKHGWVEVRRFFDENMRQEQDRIPQDAAGSIGHAFRHGRENDLSLGPFQPP